MHDTSKNYVFWGYTQTDQSVLRTAAILRTHSWPTTVASIYTIFFKQKTKTIQTAGVMHQTTAQIVQVPSIFFYKRSMD